jgi:hypothetical protein
MMLWGGGSPGKWLGHEGDMLMNELVIREVSDSLCALSTTQKTQQKGIIYEPESQPSLDADPTSASVLVFPDSRTARNKFLLFLTYPLCRIVL